MPHHVLQMGNIAIMREEPALNIAVLEGRDGSSLSAKDKTDFFFVLPNFPKVFSTVAMPKGIYPVNHAGKLYIHF